MALNVDSASDAPMKEAVGRFESVDGVIRYIYYDAETGKMLGPMLPDGYMDISEAGGNAPRIETASVPQSNDADLSWTNQNVDEMEQSFARDSVRDNIESTNEDIDPEQVPLQQEESPKLVDFPVVANVTIADRPYLVGFPNQSDDMNITPDDAIRISQQTNSPIVEMSRDQVRDYWASRINETVARMESAPSDQPTQPSVNADRTTRGSPETQPLDLEINKSFVPREDASQNYVKDTEQKKQMTNDSGLKNSQTDDQFDKPGPW